MRDDISSRDPQRCNTSHRVWDFFWGGNHLHGFSSEPKQPWSNNTSIGYRNYDYRERCSKVAKAKNIWKEAGTDVEKWIDAWEGNLLEVLEQDKTLPPVVDLVFLDAWTSLALPALKLIIPRLRNGSVIVADRTVKGKALYHDFLTFVRDPRNGFMSLTIPFPEGFEIIVYNRGRVLS